MAIRGRYHAARSSRKSGRGAPAAPARRPPLSAGGCALSSACAPLGNLFRSVGRVGSLPLWSCRRCRSSIVAPSVFVCCGCPRFHISASVLSLPPSPCGVTPAPCGLPCSSRLRRVALVGLLRRSFRRAIRHAPSGALPSVGTSVAPCGRGFFRLARCFACRVSGGFPSVRLPEVCPPAPLPECPPLAHIFCPARGAGIPIAVLGAPAPAPLAGGVFAAPLHPLRPRRGERCFS